MRPILLVENDPVQARAVERAFDTLKVGSLCIHSTDGKEALTRLWDHTGEKPWLILLSLDLPGMSSVEFLETVKSDKVLKRIPVILLTASSHQDDITRSFELGASGYMIKDSEHDGLVETIRTIIQYWRLCEWPVN